MRMTKTVGHLLQSKGHDVWWVAPNASVYAALHLMADKNVGVVLVFDDGNLVGVFSERDYARKVVLKGRSSRYTPIRKIMTPIVASVLPEHSIEDCMELMIDKRVRHLPVLEDDRVVGVISIGDVVKSLLDEQGFIISQLEQYIAGSVR
jgi:CBS domain-containing protein